jgi:hypothetical protein
LRLKITRKNDLKLYNFVIIIILAKAFPGRRSERDFEK